MEPKNAVTTEFYKGFTNFKCEFFPCHKNILPLEKYNCLFCYCPLAFLKCPGPYKIFTSNNGIIRKDCSECTLPHKGIKKSWNFIQHWLKTPINWNGE
jgi:Zn-finger protein